TRARGRRAGSASRRAGRTRGSPRWRRRGTRASQSPRRNERRATGAGPGTDGLRSPSARCAKLAVPNPPSAALLRRLLAVVLVAQEFQAALQQVLGHEQALLVVVHRGAVVGGELHLAAHHDRLLGAGLLAQAAEHAARHVDVERLRVALDARARELARHDADAIGRARELAQAARDTLGLAVVELHEHRHAAGGVRAVAALLP